MNPDKSGWYLNWGKRWMDVVFSFLGIAVTAVPMVLIGLFSWIFQGFPILFSQERIGRFGQRITVWKFRTMRVRSIADSPVTVAGDFRVTAWGQFLRKFKLDELPQLFCVLNGSMSFVGPRPDVPGYWDVLSDADKPLLQLRPGITSPATLVFREEESILARSQDPKVFNDTVLFPEKVRLTWLYYEKISLVSDIKWILRTFLPGPKLQDCLQREGWKSPVIDDTSEEV